MSISQYEMSENLLNQSMKYRTTLLMSKAKFDKLLIELPDNLQQNFEMKIIKNNYLSVHLHCCVDMVQNNCTWILQKGTSSIDKISKLEEFTVDNFICLEISTRSFSETFYLGVSYMKALHHEQIASIAESLQGINGYDKHGYFWLYQACRFNDKDSIKELLEHGANVNQQKPDGTSCLMLATYNRSYYQVDSLIQAGINVNAQALHGMTALHFALKKRDFYIANLLIKKGANIYLDMFEMAIILGHAGIINHLLSQSNNSIELVNSQLPKSHMPPIQMAWESGQGYIMGQLLFYGAYITGGMSTAAAFNRFHPKSILLNYFIDTLNLINTNILERDILLDPIALPNPPSRVFP